MPAEEMFNCNAGLCLFSRWRLFSQTFEEAGIVRIKKGTLFQFF
jgi:hypothetical protein